MNILLDHQEVKIFADNTKEIKSRFPLKIVPAFILIRHEITY